MTYDTHRALVKGAAAQLALSPHDAEALFWAHETDLRTDPATGHVAYEGGHADFASWMRATAEAKPYLVGKREGVQASAPSSNTPAGSVSSLMAQARSGDPAATAALNKRLGLA